MEVEMKSITSIEKARALPERSPIREKVEKQSDGTLLRIPYFPLLVSVELGDNTILFFHDKDGREMEIGYDVEGAYKYER